MTITVKPNNNTEAGDLVHIYNTLKPIASRWAYDRKNEVVTCVVGARYAILVDLVRNNWKDDVQFDVS